MLPGLILPEEDTYKVHTETFEGPMDLLLHLIKKNKMDILDIRLSEITSEYLSYLNDRTRLNPEREGDFIMTAGTLIYIKSRSLLPRPEALQEESPEEKLVNTLIEYDKIQKISKLLKELESQEIILWKREEIIEHFDNKEFHLEEVSAFQLAEIFLNIVKRSEKEEYLYVDSKEYSIEKKWGEIEEVITAAGGYLNFAEYIETLDCIEDVLVSFFTILEMIKRRVLLGVQKELFAPISLWKTNTDEEGKEVIQ